MIKGLYRMQDRLLGPAVRVHWTGGDAAPVVSETVYLELNGVPALEQLHDRSEYVLARTCLAVDPFEEEA
jgi:hypothetical protein